MMEGLVTILLVLGGVAWHWWRKGPGVAASSPWRIAAEACKLTGLMETWNSLEGRSGRLRVRFERYAQDENQSGTRIVVDGVLLSPDELTLRRESLGTALGKKLGAREIELGDWTFDSEFYLQGPVVLVRAIFDAETRRLVRSLLVDGGDVEVSGSELRIDIPDSVSHGWSSLLAVYLRSALAVAERLNRPDDIAQRLAANARSDPEAQVRLPNLLTLVRECPPQPVTREVLRAACGDENEEIQLQAGIALGQEGRGFLMEVASREWTDDSYTARAVVALRKNLPRERASAILKHALRTRRVETARACLAALGHHGDAEAVEALAKVMVVERSELAAEAARALGATGQPAAEGPLIKALKGDSAELRVAVVEALGRVGTVEAVLPLKGAEGRYPDDRDLRRAARQAIAAIQSRLTGASPGQLSLAEGEAGQLSLAKEDEKGRLSLDHGDAATSDACKAGRLSVKEEE